MLHKIGVLIRAIKRPFRRLNRGLKRLLGRRPVSLKTRRFLDRCESEVKTLSPRVALDLGSGPVPRNQFAVNTVYGIDIESVNSPAVQEIDLSANPIPFEPGSLDLVTAYDFVEHVPRWERRGGVVRYPFIELMNEIYRVLKPGGLFYSETPAFPAPEAFQDPTHVNIISEKTFPEYFSNPKNWASIYGFTGGFDFVGQAWRGPHLLVLLKKPSGR